MGWGGEESKGTKEKRIKGDSVVLIADFLQGIP